MDTGWFWLIVFVAVLWMLSKGRGGTSKRASKTKKEDWLEARWARLEKEKRAGGIVTG